MGRPSRSRHRRGEDILIDLSDYGRLVRVDREAGRATFEAGVTRRHLDLTLGAWGLSLENGSRRPAQALGAAISLGAHGSGARFGGLATQVTALRLITPDGHVVACSGDEEPEIFRAALVGLGALGVISTVTLRCQPGFNVRVQSATIPWAAVGAGFDGYADGNDYFELSWLPGRDRARVVTANRTDDAADGDRVDRCYRWWNRTRLWPPRNSYAFDRRDSGPALERARALSGGPGRAALFPIEVSVSAGDDLALSPASGRPSLFIAGVAGLDGRPEWGTPHGLGPAALAARYPRWDEWQAVRARLDPDRRLAQPRGQG